MNQKLKAALFAFGVSVALLIAVMSTVHSVRRGQTVSVFAPMLNELSDVDNNMLREKVFEFENGARFQISRLEFSPQTIAAGQYTYKVALKGKGIEIRWQDYAAQPRQWRTVSDLSQLPKATLFVQTDSESMILSIPALYYNRFEHKTIEALPERELAARVEETPEGYEFILEFQPIAETIGELWYYKYPGTMLDWSPVDSKIWLAQDLHSTRRFCFDGYYFQTYTTYSPYAENGFFRNPANYTGAHIINNFAQTPAIHLGYAFTKICMENQNELGFWETGPTSQWLQADYGIGYDFYDTRFSTDFSRSLVKAYGIFGDEACIESANRYADFLVRYAAQEGYPVGTAQDEGVLVPDYWSETQQTKPHVSLNHQLAEINFLLELYVQTGEKQADYYEMAMKMLRGIEITCDSWILEDGNLKYALMYFDTSNDMIDYPYLTYNDLYETRDLLATLGKESPQIERLMDSKKQWMDANGITQYKGNPAQAN